MAFSIRIIIDVAGRRTVPSITTDLNSITHIATPSASVIKQTNRATTPEDLHMGARFHPLHSGMVGTTVSFAWPSSYRYCPSTAGHH